MQMSGRSDRYAHCVFRDLMLTTTAQGDPPAWVMILGGIVVVAMVCLITYRRMK